MRIEPDFYSCEPVVVFGVQRTLLELLGVVSDRHGSVPIAICVSSRDELDAVCAAVANLPFVSLSPLVCSSCLGANFHVQFSDILCGCIIAYCGIAKCMIYTICSINRLILQGKTLIILTPLSRNYDCAIADIFIFIQRAQAFLLFCYPRYSDMNVVSGSLDCLWSLL